MTIANVSGIETIIAAFFTGIVGPIIVMLITHYMEKRKKNHDMLKEACEIGKMVSAKIDDIKEEFEADRVFVIQFHNGGHFYPTGKSIAKFSMFYESVTADAISIQSNFQNIPVNLFNKSINELLENDIIAIPDYKDETIATFGLKYIAETSGCKSGYLFAIRNIDGKFVGILGIDFTTQTANLDEDIINELTNRATAIGGVLMNHLTYK